MTRLPASIFGPSRSGSTLRSTILLDAATRPSRSPLAIQSLQLWSALPGFDRDNRLQLLPPTFEPRAWLGNRVTVAAHHDPSENIACVVAGKRIFTLFPPDEGRQPVPRPVRADPCRADDQHGRFRRAGPGSLSTVCDRAGPRTDRRTVPPATRSTSLICGGTTSARPIRSTCSSIIGGARRRPPSGIRWKP